MNEQSPIQSFVAELSQLYRVDQLPKYRSGIVEQISSYDPTGLNDDGFEGKYSYLRKEGNALVLADLTGPGVINRIWTPTPTTDTIQFYFDGETTPRINIPFIDLFSGKVYPFVKPICGNEAGGYFCYIPIPYQKSCKIVFQGEKIEFHQIQYRPYAEGSSIPSFRMDFSPAERQELEQAVQFWSGAYSPLDYLNYLGETLQVETRQFALTPGQTVSFFSTKKGGRIVGIEIEDGGALEGANKNILLQAYWDGDVAPAIDAPAADFFGYAFGVPGMRSILAGHSPEKQNYSYLPMPYQKRAKLKMVYMKRDQEVQPNRIITTKVYYTNQPQNPEWEGRLYTEWRREVDPEKGKPYTIAELNGRGHYVGTIHLAQGLQPGMTLFFEGDDSIVVDKKLRIHGTGSEDYYNGGWYALLDRWDRGVSLPIHGALDYSLPMARTGGYRFYLTDKMTYEQEFLLTIEHGPEHNAFPVDYTTMAFYYGTTPSEHQTTPTEPMRTVYYPTTHVVFPQLMNFALGRYVSIENRRHIIAKIDSEKEGLLRIMLDDIPEGRYKVKLSYIRVPNGCEFSVWNRQNLLMDWQDSSAEKDTFVDQQEMGIFDLTRQTNSISIKLRKTKGGNNEFQFQNLYLEKQ